MAPNPPPPLQGVRVLDLSRLLPGPLCGQHLADLGAEVIKIEDPDVGDYVKPTIRSLVNRGKKGLSLNLKTEAGREIFMRLVATSDVLIESFRPGVMERLGLGPRRLLDARPSMVYCAITGYGQIGSRVSAPGHDINYVALSGTLERTGAPGGPPVIPGFLLADILGGTLTAAMAILSALFGARATGIGRIIDVSMLDALVAHSILPLAELQEAGASSPRGQGLHNGGTARYNIYRARDGRFIAIGAEETKFWNVLCSAIGAPELSDLPDKPRPPEALVAERLQAIFSQRDAAEWLAMLEPLDCCVSSVLTFEEALADPDIASRAVIRDEEKKKPFAFRPPFLMSGLDRQGPAQAPSRGQDSRAILESLGYGRIQIDSFASQGVI